MSHSPPLCSHLLDESAGPLGSTACSDNMATNLGSQTRSVPPDPAIRDILLALGLGAFKVGSDIGLGSAFIQETYYALRQAPIRPRFLRTTGLVAGTIAGGIWLYLLCHEITGSIDTVAEFRKPIRGTNIHPDMEQMRPLSVLFIASIVSGAGMVALRSGFHRGNVFRMIGGGCVGFATVRVAAVLLGSANGKPSMKI